MWSSSTTICGILSRPSHLVGLGVMSLLNTATGVMTTSGKHTPSELLANFSGGILVNVSFQKTREKNKFNVFDFFICFCVVTVT